VVLITHTHTHTHTHTRTHTHTHTHTYTHTHTHTHAHTHTRSQVVRKALLENQHHQLLTPSIRSDSHITKTVSCDTNTVSYDIKTVSYNSKAVFYNTKTVTHVCICILGRTPRKHRTWPLGAPPETRGAELAPHVF
jgi:hypothetical protein